MAKKVLIIDDDFDLVEAMRITLEAAGYDVIDAQDGEKGLEKIKIRISRSGYSGCHDVFHG